jgi:hypothetical protein
MFNNAKLLLGMSEIFLQQLIHEAVKHGDTHAETMETADYYLLVNFFFCVVHLIDLEIHTYSLKHFELTVLEIYCSMYRMKGKPNAEFEYYQSGQLATRRWQIAVV